MVVSKLQFSRLVLGLFLIALLLVLSGCSDPEALPTVTSGSVENTPPSASFSSNCTDLICTFDASTSGDPDGSIIGYSWNYGDSSNGTSITTAHT
jgi:hypothetical protein